MNPFEDHSPDNKKALKNFFKRRYGEDPLDYIRGRDPIDSDGYPELSDRLPYDHPWFNHRVNTIGDDVMFGVIEPDEQVMTVEDEIYNTDEVISFCEDNSMENMDYPVDDDTTLNSI